MTRFASGEAGFFCWRGEVGRGAEGLCGERVYVEKFIFGGRGCRALRDASKDTSFRLEGENYI